MIMKEISLHLLDIVQNSLSAGADLIEVFVKVNTNADLLTVSVADNGSGMDAATLARACEPFFTTKRLGLGSGLGLAMAYGFAKQSGGGISIHSQPG